MPIATHDLKFQRLVSWLRTMARVRGLTLCEPKPGFFYVFETNEPANRLPIIGAIPAQALANYFERERILG